MYQSMYICPLWYYDNYIYGEGHNNWIGIGMGMIASGVVMENTNQSFSDIAVHSMLFSLRFPWVLVHIDENGGEGGDELVGWGWGWGW